MVKALEEIVISQSTCDCTVVYHHSFYVSLKGAKSVARSEFDSKSTVPFLVDITLVALHLRS